jgi:proteasome beta subunit
MDAFNEWMPVQSIKDRYTMAPAFGMVSQENASMAKKTGTTTIGIIGKDFVLLGADQQATMGSMAIDDDAKKIYKITKRISLTISGSVGDSLAVIRFLKSQAAMYEVERGVKMTTRALSTLLSNILNGNRYYPFIFAPIIGGTYKKPELYELTPYGCVSKKTKYAVTGSGTMFAVSVLDSDYKENMTREEAIALALKAISTAKNRDIYTGGKNIALVYIDKKGSKKVEQAEIDKALAKIKGNFSKKGN